jgi:hypothetical protein
MPQEVSLSDLLLDYYPTPTISAFIESTATVNILISPEGEGKTWGCIQAAIRHAMRCKKAIRGAIVRDTLENIKLSIVPSFQEFFEKVPEVCIFKNEFKELNLLTDPPIQFDLFGIDDPVSLSKFQGPSAYSVIWLNEPCPMISRSNAGLAEEVYNAALSRCVRRTGTLGRLQVDMNPGSQEHWSYRRFVLEPDVMPEYPLIQKRVFNVPYGENIYRTAIQRQATMRAYQNDPAAWIRYVEGQFAPRQLGVAVTSQYSRKKHMLLDVKGNPIPLEPAPGLEGFAFFDSWGNPAVVLGQISQLNRLIYLDTIYLPQSDVETLLETRVAPLLESPRWEGKCRAWRIGGDATMENMDQSTRARSAARMVEEFFRRFSPDGCRFEPAPKEWKMIEPQISWALTHNDARGEPLILLSGDNSLLEAALSGGWHYTKNNAGERASAAPVKDAHSHPGDAWAASVCRLLPSHRAEVKLLDNYRHLSARLRRRAEGYSTRVGR